MSEVLRDVELMGEVKKMNCMKHNKESRVKCGM